MYEIAGFNKYKDYFVALFIVLVSALLISTVLPTLLEGLGNIFHFIAVLLVVALGYFYLLLRIQRKIKAHLQLTKDLINSINDVVVVKDFKGNFVFCNEALAKLYNTTPTEMVGKDDYYFTKNKQQADFFRESVQSIMQRFEKEEVYESSTDINTGETRHFHSAKIPFRDAKGAVKVAIIAKDITAITQLKEESEKNKKRLEQVLEVSEEGLWEWNTLTNQVLHNRQWEFITGIESSANTLSEFENAILVEDRAKVFAALAALQQHNTPYSIEFRMKRPDGKVIWVWDRGQVAEYDNNNQPTWIVGIIQDITKEKLNQQKIANLAYYDQLTGLTNRSQLEVELSNTIKQSDLQDCYSALLVLDLDRFKLLNDSYGHHMGDKLLELIAKKLHQLNQQKQIIARFGGDEFVLVLPLLSASHQQATSKAQDYANKVLAQISQPLQLKSDLKEVEIEYSITASIGGIVFKSAELSTGQLLQLADIVMYRAKKAGGNAALIFDTDMQEDLKNISNLQKNMRDAIVNKEFCIHLQPKYDISETIIGAEALVRWQHPKLGLLYPDSFIKMAEESNGIIEIGTMVLELACQQLHKWQSAKATEKLQIAVNLSAKQIWHNQFVEDMISVIEAYHINPSGLIFEVTESVLIQDINDAIEKLGRLKAYGVSISLDDFGTGYSSMNYLRSLPIDELKIDRSFVKDVTTDHAAHITVKSIIDLALNFDLKVVSEGVEEKQQFELLRSYQVTSYQGYYFSKPLPVDEFNQLVTATEASLAK